MDQGKQLLAEINEARAHPHECIEDVKQQLARFESNTVMRTRKGDKLRVVEGKSAWQDAVLFLQRTKPKQPLNWSKELADTAQTYLSIRTSSDPNPFKLLKSRYSYEASISFNVNESEVTQTLRELVIAMIVGDGDEKKGNRTTLFHPTYSHFGGVVQKTKMGMFVPMFFSETGKFELKQGTQVTQKHQETKGNRVVYTDRGKELIAELNRIRKDPKSIVGQLKSDLERFKDQKTLVKDNVTIKTKEGRAGYLDLISELEEQYPIPLLRVSDGLCAASADQVLELELDEQLQGKADTEGLTHYQGLIKKYCLQSESVNNIIMNRSQEDSYSNMLILLLVGDGDKKRSARRKLLSPVLKISGAAVGSTFFVVNIGESARDNKEAIELAGKSPQKQSNKELHKEPYKEAKDQSSPPTSKQSPSVNKPMPSSSRAPPPEEERVIKKKTTKSTTVMRGGKHYKQTTTKILYADGETEELEEEQLLDY